MRVHRLKRETTEGDFGLFNAQLYVGELSDPDGNRLKGLAILIPGQLNEIPFELKTADAQVFVSLLDKATPANPAFSFEASDGIFTKFHFNLDEHLDEWLGQTGYQGSASLIGKWFPMKISESTLRQLSDCLKRFYELR